MSTSGDRVLERIRAVEADFADAMTRMYAVGNELSELRAHLELEASPEGWRPVGPETASAPPPPSPPWAAQGTPPAPAAPPPPVPQPPRVPLWQREGIVSRILAAVGAGITLIGVAFLLALAISLGLFGPLLRVLGGAVLALGLVVAALVLRHRQSRTAGAVGIAATGFATAYLDVLAVTRVYEWVPPAAGLLLAAVIGLSGLLLGRVWGSQLLGCITVLGVALLAPFVGAGHTLLTAAFLLVLAGVSWPAQVGRRWHVLEAVRVVPTALYLAGVVLVSDDLAVPALLTVLLAILVLGTNLAGARARSLPEQLGALVPVAALPMVVAGLVVDDRWMGAALLLALTCLLVLLAGLADHPPRTGAHLRHPEFALPTAGAASLLAAGTLASGTDWVLPSMVLIALGWAVGALALRHPTTLFVALGVLAICLLGSLGLLPLVLLRGEADQVAAPDLLSVLGLVAATLLLARAATTTLPVAAAAVARLLVGVAVLWSGAAVVLVGALLGRLADEAAAGFTGGQAAATVLWLAIATVLLLRGLRGSSVAVPAGLGLAALGVGKLLLFDLAFLDGIARVLGFIVGGLLLLAMGAGYAHALDRARRESARAPVENSAPTGPTPPTV